MSLDIQYNNNVVNEPISDASNDGPSVNNKYSKDDWHSIEQNISKFDLQVLKTLKNYVDNSVNTSSFDETEYKVFGEKIYLLARTNINTKEIKLIESY